MTKTKTAQMKWDKIAINLGWPNEVIFLSWNYYLLKKSLNDIAIILRKFEPYTSYELVRQRMIKHEFVLRKKGGANNFNGGISKIENKRRKETNFKLKRGETNE